MRNVSKDFSGVRVLEDVSFDLKQGEVHVLAGENGAGKSTLMKILCGVHTEYGGEMILDGKPLRLRSPHDASARGIAMIHQELSLIGSLPVMDNMFLGREKTRGGIWLDRRAQKKRVREALRRLEVDVDPCQPVGELPMASRQLVEIAKALAFDARLLVMDEPTSSLNEPEVERFFRLIGELKQSCGIVYISHKMDEIYRLADRITVLRDGRHIITAAAGNLPRHEFVRHLVGRTLTEQFPARKASPGNVVLEVRDFGVTAPGARQSAVRDVSFSLRAGEVVGIAGLQGSGNSELLHGLFGSFGGGADGQVRLKAERYRPASPRRAMDKGLALLTNDRKESGLVAGMSIARNITLASLRRFSTLGWLRNGMEREAVDRQSTALKIRMASSAQEVRELSGGNQQKVVLAKWLETRPSILLLDEPTRGVDVGAKHEIYALIDQWISEGMAIMLSTSELPELLALSDRILVMHRGRIRAEFARAEATQEKIVQAAMGE